MLEAMDSTNGTFHRRPPGDFREVHAQRQHRQPLRAGDLLHFGDEADVWEVLEAESPFPEAEELERRRKVPSDGAALLLPDSEDPVVAIYEEDGGYVIHQAGLEDDGRPLTSDVVEIEGRRFRLRFDAAQPTARAFRGELRRGALEHSIRAGCPHLAFVEGAQRLDLGTYISFGVIRTLALARDVDRKRALNDTEVGWRERASLRHTSQAASLDLWRCQQRLRSVGLRGTDVLFEKRQGEGVVRLGMDIEIVHADQG